MTFDYKPYLSLASATAAGQAVVLLVSPIVTRLYTQEHFGAFSLLLGAGALLGSMAAGRLELAIPAAHTPLAVSRRFVLGVSFLAGSTALAALAVALLRLFDLVPGEVWKPLPLFTIPLVCCAIALSQLSGALLLWHKNYRTFGYSKMTQGITTGFFQIVLGLLALGSPGLVVAQLLGYLLAATVGVRKLLPGVIQEIRTHGADLKNTLIETRRYPLIMVPSALLNQASQQLPLLAITYLFGLFEAGLFALTYRICAAPLGLIGQSVAQVYASQFRGVAAEGGGVLAVHLRMLTGRLLMVGLVAVAMLVMGLTVADRVGLFGPGWARFGEISLYLAPMFLLDFVVSPLSTTLAYIGRQRLQLIWDAGRFAAIAAAFAAAASFGMSFERTLVFYALVWAMGQAVHFLLSYNASRNGQLVKTGELLP